jgi:hypothetical protein
MARLEVAGSGFEGKWYLREACGSLDTSQEGRDYRRNSVSFLYIISEVGRG